MEYKICDTEKRHWYRILMDYDHAKMVALSDRIGADNRFVFYAYYSRSDIGVGVISVYVAKDSPLKNETNEYIKDVLLSHCSAVLGECN